MLKRVWLKYKGIDVYDIASDLIIILVILGTIYLCIWISSLFVPKPQPEPVVPKNIESCIAPVHPFSISKNTAKFGPYLVNFSVADRVPHKELRPILKEYIKRSAYIIQWYTDLGLTIPDTIKINSVLYSVKSYIEKYDNNSSGKFFSNNGHVDTMYDIHRVEASARVLMHETVHATNLRVFGPIPLWLNEGLAVLIAGLDDFGELNLRENSYYDYDIPIHSLHHVMNWPNDWSNLSKEDRTRYYYNSWLVVSFLLDNIYAKSLFTELLKEKNASKCLMPRDYDWYEALTSKKFTIEQDYYDWLKAKKLYANRH